jgi:hypothetical protein
METEKRAPGRGTKKARGRQIRGDVGEREIDREINGE